MNESSFRGDFGCIAAGTEGIGCRVSSRVSGRTASRIHFNKKRGSVQDDPRVTLRVTAG